MNVVMGFPETVEEFMESYKMTDTEHIYSNGIEYVPIFRMKQWFEHIKGNEEGYKKMWNELKKELEEYADSMEVLYKLRFNCNIRAEYEWGTVKAYRAILSDMKLMEDKLKGEKYGR